MLISWEPNPCGAPPIGYSVYAVNSTFHGTPPQYTAQEIVDLGIRIVKNTPYTEIIYTGKIGQTKTVDFAVIAHASASESQYDSSPASVNVSLI